MRNIGHRFTEYRTRSATLRAYRRRQRAFERHFGAEMSPAARQELTAILTHHNG
jgi:hypothetical protein